LNIVITPLQKKLIMVLAGLFAIDNLITLYGVFFYGPGFYEANPIARYFLVISPWVFLGAITVMKIAGLALLIGMVHFCNVWKDEKISPWYNGEAWGTRLCSYGVLSMSSALAALTVMNLV